MQRAPRGKTSAVLDAGGLHILGTERHESRRIDNQPVVVRDVRVTQASRFYISLEDNLMRIFMGNMAGIMQKVGMERVSDRERYGDQINRARSA